MHVIQYQPHIISNEEDNEKFLAIVEKLMSRPSLTFEENAILLEFRLTIIPEHTDLNDLPSIT